MWVLQALERKTPTDLAGSTGSAFTFLNDTDSTTDNHGWEVSTHVAHEYAWLVC
jgi:hypothetical protein